MKVRFPISAMGVLKASDKVSSRYALGGVLLERKGNTASATCTDGRVLLHASWSDNGDDVDAEALVPVDAVEKASKAADKRETFVDVDASGETEVRLSTASTTLSTKVVEGRFPRYRDVIPNLKAVPHVKVRLDAAFLKKICEAALKMKPKECGIDVYVTDDGSPVVMTLASELGEMLAVIAQMSTE
jgi:DNA polymerase-3 subunit beta